MLHDSFLVSLRPEIFRKNKKRINRENHTGVELFLLFNTAILILNVLGQISDMKQFMANKTLLAQIIYDGAALLFYVLFLRNRNRNYTVWIYVLEAPILLITMIGGIIRKPDELTFTFMFFLLLFPLLILDVPWRIITFVVSMSLVYGAVASNIKNPSVFSRDMIHLINVDLMCMAASLYFLSVRIRNIEYADYFEEKADMDPLTGLYNRSGAASRIDPALPGIFLYMDLDHFKEINDLSGHEEGDNVIKETADVLRETFRRKDVIMRLGGDEFAVFAPGEWNEESIREKMLMLLEKIRSMPVAGADKRVTASIGCVFAPDGSKSLQELARTADHAMYQVKNNGKDNFIIVTMQ